MASKERDFLWYGERHSYVRGEKPAAEAHSREYGAYNHCGRRRPPRTAGRRLPLRAGDSICFSWMDDEDQTSWTWVPRGDIRKVTDSEWDIHQFNRASRPTCRPTGGSDDCQVPTISSRIWLLRR